MTLPDLWNERGLRRDPPKFSSEHPEVNLPIQDLESIAIDTGRVAQMEMPDMWTHGGHEMAERPVVVCTSELGV